MKERENNCRKNPWRFVFAALAVYSGWELLCYMMSWLIADVFGGVSFNITKAATIGVIGGADGPTAIFVTAAANPVWELLLWAVLLAVGICGFLHFRKDSESE